MYPPASHLRLISWLQVVFFIFFIFLYAILDQTLLKNIWIKAGLPGWFSAFSTAIIVLMLLWLFRPSKAWVFKWEKDNVKVHFTGNLLGFTWVYIYIDNALILSKRFWACNKVNLSTKVTYKGKNIIVKLNIIPVEIWHQVECDISFNNEYLAVEGNDRLKLG